MVGALSNSVRICNYIVLFFFFFAIHIQYNFLIVDFRRDGGSSSSQRSRRHHSSRSREDGSDRDRDRDRKHRHKDRHRSRSHSHRHKRKRSALLLHRKILLQSFFKLHWLIITWFPWNINSVFFISGLPETDQVTPATKNHHRPRRDLEMARQRGGVKTKWSMEPGRRGGGPPLLTCPEAGRGRDPCRTSGTGAPAPRSASRERYECYMEDLSDIHLKKGACEGV